MKSKNAVELSINFMVVIIISIIVLSMGIFLMAKAFSQAEDITKWNEDRLKSQMAALNCGNDEMFCTSENNVILAPGKRSYVFGAKILNIFNVDTKFKLDIKPNAFDESNNPIATTDFLFTDKIGLDPTKTIASNTAYDFGIAVQIGSNKPKGTYTLSVEAQYLESGTWTQYGQKQLLSIVVQ